MKLVPLGDNVIIEPLSREEKTKSGILLPETHEKERPQEGKVIAVGPGKILENGMRREMEVKVGNKVLFTKYGPHEIKLDDGETKKEYLIAKEDDILAVIE